MRKYTNSQLKWLAESLTNSQIAFLLEDENEENLKNANQNADIVDEPKNPGMSSVENKAGMKPNVEQANNTPEQNTNSQQKPQQPQQTQKAPANDDAQVKTVCNAIKNGKLNKIEPNQLNNFLKSGNIAVKNVAKSIKYAIDYAASMLKNPKTMNMGVFKSTIAGINNCLGAITAEKNEISESILRDAKNYNVDLKNLGSNIKNGNVFNVMKAGKALNECDSNIIKSVNNIKANIKNLKGHNKKVFNSLNESLKELNNSSIEKRINEYYSLVKYIKNLTTLAESKNVKLVEFNNLQKVTAIKNKNINESISAIKYSMNFYNKNK